MTKLVRSGPSFRRTVRSRTWCVEVWLARGVRRKQVLERRSLSGGASRSKGMAVSEYPANWFLLVYGPPAVGGAPNWQVRTTARAAAERALSEVVRECGVSNPQFFIVCAHTDWQDGRVVDRVFSWDDQKGELVEEHEKYCSRSAKAASQGVAVTTRPRWPGWSGAAPLSAGRCRRPTTSRSR